VSISDQPAPARESPERVAGHRRNILLFLVAIACLGAAGSVQDSTFNNYLNDNFQMTAADRGFLEFPRESPGLLITLVVGGLFFLGETHLVVLAAGLTALGLAGLGLWSASYGHMLFWLILWSTGLHLTLPVQDSIALALSRGERRGEMLGTVGAAAALASVIGCVLVWLNFAVLKRSYGTTYVFAAVAALAASFTLSRMHAQEINSRRRPKLLLRRRYWLYYLLAILFGARKQVFITFGVWVLIRVYGQPAKNIAILWIITTTAGVLFRPLVGRLIDRLGERLMLMASGVALFFVCLAYGYAEFLGSRTVALAIICTAYVLDQMLFTVETARSTYLSKIAEKKSDVGATLSAGVSINHAVSIPIAMLGGRIWDATSYHVLFAGAAALALLITATCALVRVPAEGKAPPETRPEELAGEGNVIPD
jgi:predicted MFS family arabinose efflux permease